jgi:hypothetical protein
MKRAVLVIIFVLAYIAFFQANPVHAQYNDCMCVGTSCSDPVPGLGTDCSTGTVGTCGTGGCTIDFAPVQQFCGSQFCGNKCTYFSTCKGPADCSCSGQGNCSDPVPNSGMDCIVGDNDNACGTSPCSSSYRPIEQKCEGDGKSQSCGYKCIFDQNCSTGYCQSNPSANPPISCQNYDGDFLCGSGGCNGCSRYIQQTICNESQCQVQCSPDDICGVGSRGGGSIL